MALRLFNNGGRNSVVQKRVEGSYGIPMNEIVIEDVPEEYEQEYVQAQSHVQAPMQRHVDAQVPASRYFGEVDMPRRQQINVGGAPEVDYVIPDYRMAQAFAITCTKIPEYRREIIKIFAVLGIEEEYKAYASRFKGKITDIDWI